MGWLEHAEQCLAAFSARFTRYACLTTATCGGTFILIHVAPLKTLTSDTQWPVRILLSTMARLVFVLIVLCYCRAWAFVGLQTNFVARTTSRVSCIHHLDILMPPLDDECTQPATATRFSLSVLSRVCAKYAGQVKRHEPSFWGADKTVCCIMLHGCIMLPSCVSVCVQKAIVVNTCR